MSAEGIMVAREVPPSGPNTTHELTSSPVEPSQTDDFNTAFIICFGEAQDTPSPTNSEETLKWGNAASSDPSVVV
jgi:hypothetical protein